MDREDNVAGSARDEALALVDQEDMCLGEKMEDLFDKNTALRKQLLAAFDRIATLEDEHEALRKEIASLRKKLAVMTPLHSVSPKRKE